MRHVFEQLISEFHESEWPRPVNRDLDLPELPENVRKAYVFVGMRRSGKTWAMFQQMQSLLAQGVHRESIVYFNFEDDRLASMSVDDFQALLDAYFTLYPSTQDTGGLHFFFDEIHQVDGWPKFIRRLLDQERMKIFLSGSSAKMLSKEIASSLRGRTITREIFPFAFREYLRFLGEQEKDKKTARHQSMLQHHSREYLQYGGFPEALSMDARFHRELLQGYVDVVIFRDIVERHNVKNVHVLKAFLQHNIENAGSLMSVNKIYHRFKSRGMNIGKDSLYQFMDYLTDAYVHFFVERYSHSLSRRANNPKKVYVIDPGLIMAYSVKLSYENAALLENSVFLQLRRWAPRIFYYKTQNDLEVDFFVPGSAGNHLVQACVSLADEETKRREVEALTEAMGELKLSQGTIVTIQDEETVAVSSGKIRVIPFCRWALDDTMKEELNTK